ncbi:hypothetical protein [Geminocystis sp. NIES-3709]|uniref:hypothetical protein n=1 Tax=Geminocystis sp. NIES-3709 TaxID=1617448 RepID=UPI0005FC7DED|nr:hypothetical protein [Geminocystis sp. NIES-3709]BAQ67107.1 hypothetical protein GM3709_3872 [Geminocystis sp. NIES-3709]
MLDPNSGIGAIVTKITPTGVGQLLNGLGVAVGVALAVNGFVASTIQNLEYRDKKRRRACCQIKRVFISR